MPRRKRLLSLSNVCPSCGAVNAPANLFCTNCGKPLQPSMPPPAFPPRDAAAPPPYPYAGPPAAPPVAYPGAYPGTYPGPYVYRPPPRQATFSTILSAMFDVWTKNFVNFFLVFLVVALVDGLIGVLIYYATFNTFAYAGGILPDFTTTPGSVDVP